MAILAGAFGQTSLSSAQTFARYGTEFNAVRSVTVQEGKAYTIVVCEFLHQGEIRPDGRNVVVLGQNKEPVPMRVLQVGPGDACRLAFQTVAGQSEYEIFYGGEPPTERSPPWTCRDGLLLETREFAPCDLKSLDALRQAFDKATPLGADYVDGVFHGCNPMTLATGPFLSHYSGYLDIRTPGVYGLIVSSRDCSFLLIDDQQVAAAPGRHGPEHHALPKNRHDVQLAAGEHKFDYYHAAAGADAVMVAVWEPNPAGEKPQRAVTIPPEAFRADLVAHLPATRLTMRLAKQAPDFTATVAADVPLPDNDVPLIAVTFQDASVKALTMQGAKLEWDFGDGQTSDLARGDHVYLRPGVYRVTLSVRRGGKTVKTSNRIQVDRPHQGPKDRVYSFDEALTVLEGYAPEKLDAKSLRQLVLAFEAKSAAVASQVEEAAEKAIASEQDPNRRPDAKRETAARNALENMPDGEARSYLAKAVAAGRTAFTGESAAKGDEDLLALARQIGPMARNALGDSPAAFDVWRGAAERISAAEAKAECEIMAADVAINDLLKAAEGKTLLEAASKRIGVDPRSPLHRLFSRVQGDCYAATGDGAAARKAYADAEPRDGFLRSLVETTAQGGAHARSAEEFIRLGRFDRAAEELDAWRRELPGQWADGYRALLRARYWAGRGKHAQAVAEADRLLAVNRDSPYADQLLWIAADSEMRQGRKDAAAALLHTLVKDYPGSPLVSTAKENLQKLEP